MSAIRQTLRQRISGRAIQEPETLPKPVVAQPQSVVVPAIEIAPNDPLFAYCLTAHGVLEIDALHLHSPALEAFKAAGIKLALPLVSQGELVGMLSLGARLSDQDYSRDDFRLLNNLAMQAATSLRVAQLARQQQIEARQRERIEHELRVAGIIQQTLLPKKIPTLAGYELAAYWQPARTVGGDFYDFIPLQDGRLAIIIGDVTDKGVPAALVMASTRGILRAAAERLSSPGEVLARVNDVLCPEIPEKMFVTCLYAVFDPGSGRIEYANAGHNPAYQRTANGVIELRARGMPLGLFPGMSYEEKTAQLGLGDSLLLYSDGLTEAHDAAHDMFGTGRLRALLTEHPGGTALIDFLCSQLLTFAGQNWEQEDDVTFVVLNRTRQALQTGNGTPHTLAEFSIPSEPGNERWLLQRVAEAVGELNLSPIRLERLKTAVAETAMNAMEHGNQYRADRPVNVRVAVSATVLSVFIIDQGGGHNDNGPQTPDLEAKLAGLQSPRGWGLFLVKNMVDDMRVHQEAAWHTVELMMNLEGADHAR